MNWNIKSEITYIEEPVLDFETAYDFRVPKIILTTDNVNTSIKFILSAQNKKIAQSDIKRLREHIGIQDDFEKRIRLLPSDRQHNGDDFTFITLKEKTKTGKTPKYPLTLHVQTLSNDEMCGMLLNHSNDKKGYHGWIYYDQSGQIGKYEIIKTTASRIKVYKDTL